MKHGWIYILVFVGFWSLLAERATWGSIAAGFAVSLLIYYYVKDSYRGFTFLQAFRTLPLWIRFILQLVSAIVIANVQVAGIVLSRNMAIDPVIVTYETGLKSGMLQTVLANSITLTPGTMSVDIKGQTLQIHCLNHDYAESLMDNSFERTLLRIQEALI